MCAEYLSYVKFIATEAPTFFGYIISVLASVSHLYQENIIAILEAVIPLQNVQISSFSWAKMMAC